MIQIIRTNLVPPLLERRGTRQTELDCLAYVRTPHEYQSGDKHFTDKRYYSHKTVKAALTSMHHEKCCYCESKYGTPAYLHVEHFRPKSAVRQNRASRDEWPGGYYWLAYSWANLLLACFACNTTHKSTLFPLQNPTQRARSHTHDLNREQELLVNPVSQDPRDHIRFVGDAPIAQTEQGHHTIEVLGLRRPPLTDARLEHLCTIDILGKIVKLPPDPENQSLQEEARTRLEQFMRPTAQFSSMVIDHVMANDFLS